MNLINVRRFAISSLAVLATASFIATGALAQGKMESGKMGGESKMAGGKMSGESKMAKASVYVTKDGKGYYSEADAKKMGYKDPTTGGKSKLKKMATAPKGAMMKKMEAGKMEGGKMEGGKMEGGKMGGGKM